MEPKRMGNPSEPQSKWVHEGLVLGSESKLTKRTTLERHLWRLCHIVRCIVGVAPYRNTVPHQERMAT